LNRAINGVLFFIHNASIKLLFDRDIRRNRNLNSNLKYQLNFASSDRCYRKEIELSGVKFIPGKYYYIDSFSKKLTEFDIYEFRIKADRVFAVGYFCV